MINDLGLKKKGFEFQDIKTEKITPHQLDEMKGMIGSYEELFSRRSLKYRSLGLAEKNLTEKDYRKYILEEYTFLKRPVVIIDDSIFAGSTKASAEGILKALGKNRDRF